MKTTWGLLWITFCSVLAATATAEPPDRPNVLLILADDLGYSDLGCYGSEIATPNLDSVAKTGLRFTQFYNTARCWPTRASLMTGYYPQQVRRDKLPGVKQSGGRGKRPEWAVLLPRMLKKVGYRSYHTGKWHIDGMPISEGFDQSYYLKDQGRFFNPTKHWLNDKPLPPVEKGTDFYATTKLADHAIKTLQNHSSEHADKPFLHYLAFAAPHFPLHAKPEDIDVYRHTYQFGWGVIRGWRWQRQLNSGLLTEAKTGQISAPERDLGPPYHFPDALKKLGPGEVNRPLAWNSLSDEQKSFQATKMALHAAMIHRMDIEIGRVFQQIREMGQWENTLVIFLSDNGASAEIMVRADGHDPDASPGSAATYLCLGPGWSTCSNTPFRRHKTWTHEGGISTPLLMAWPAGISAADEFRHSPGHVIDIVPTILELAGAHHEADAPALPGRSLVPVFTKDVRPSASYWWMHDDHRAIRKGDWKAVAAAGEAWELYDLGADRSESANLATSHVDQLRELTTSWENQWSEIQKLANSGEDGGLSRETR